MTAVCNLLPGLARRYAATPCFVIPAPDLVERKLPDLTEVAIGFSLRRAISADNGLLATCHAIAARSDGAALGVTHSHLLAGADHATTSFHHRLIHAIHIHAHAALFAGLRVGHTFVHAHARLLALLVHFHHDLAPYAQKNVAEITVVKSA